MDNLNLIIAANLKAVREAKKLSLDRVAELTGVSKSMLGQIERGESNPTIATVWKIANGLKVSFTSLIDLPKPDAAIVRRADVRSLSEDNERYRLYAYFPYEEGRRFESYAIEIEPGGSLSAEAHGDGTEEFITVYDGELIVEVDGVEHRVAAGDSLRFRADRPHRYSNAGAQLTRVSMVIHYPA